MANPDRQSKPDIHRTQQGVQNLSFDEVYQVLAVALLGEYNNALYRLQVDADGNLKTTSSGGSGTAAYSDSGGTDRKGLVDADRHVQVDVLTAPTTTITGTVAATQSGTWTEANSAAIKTAVETIDNAISGSEMQVDVITMPTVTTTPTAGTPYFDSDGDNTAQTMKGSTGTLIGLEVSNPNDTACYIQLFDEAGAITVGTTAPKQSYYIPANGAMDKPDIRISFTNSIKYACTTTATGSTDPTTGLVVNGVYI